MKTKITAVFTLLLLPWSFASATSKNCGSTLAADDAKMNPTSLLQAGSRVPQMPKIRLEQEINLPLLDFQADPMETIKALASSVSTLGAAHYTVQTPLPREDYPRSRTPEGLILTAMEDFVFTLDFRSRKTSAPLALRWVERALLADAQPVDREPFPSGFLVLKQYNLQSSLVETRLKVTAPVRKSPLTLEALGTAVQALSSNFFGEPLELHWSGKFSSFKKVRRYGLDIFYGNRRVGVLSLNLSEVIWVNPSSVYSSALAREGQTVLELEFFEDHSPLAHETELQEFIERLETALMTAS